MVAAYSLQLVILLYSVFNAFVGYLFFTISGLVAFTLTVIPYLVERKTNVLFPWGVHMLILIAIYLHGMGAIFGWYDTLYPVFDKVAHFTTSIIVTLMGFIIILLLDRSRSLNLTTPLFALMLISITLALGAVWEIAEFMIDQAYTLNLQRGLEDTMYDLIVDLCGAVIITVAGSLYFSRVPREQIVDTFIRRGERAESLRE